MTKASLDSSCAEPQICLLCGVVVCDGSVFVPHSLLLELRCQVHSELAVIEEEDGRLEASMTHLHKALLLDNGAQRERLSSALHLLQLRADLYQTPTRSEERAAVLLQQVPAHL